MRASVLVGLPRLAWDVEQLNRVTREHHLQVRGLHGERSGQGDDVFNISNARRLEITEMDGIDALLQGLAAIASAEG